MKKIITILTTLTLSLGCSGVGTPHLGQLAPAIEAISGELCNLSASNFEACVSECEACGCLSECVDVYVYEQALACSTSADCELEALNGFWTCTERAVNSCESCESKLEMQLEGCQG